MWTFDVKTRTTGAESGIIRRVQIEEAASRLSIAGFRNRRQVTDILWSLSDLSRGEVRASVEMAVPEPLMTPWIGSEEVC